METYELYPRYDRRKSFYGKAHEIEYADGTIELQSYSTIVARIVVTKTDRFGCIFRKAEVYGWYSQTTGRHIKEFLKQHGFKAENKSQILKDYYKEEEE